MPSSTDDALRLLGELAELGMDVARRLHEAAIAAEDPKDMIALSEAFCEAGRGMRQSIALAMGIRSGAFAVQRAAPQAEEPDAEPELDAEPQDREERPERGDWYERPDWETPLRLTGDEAQDAEIVAAAVATAVTRIRKRYAKARPSSRPGPNPAPGPPSSPASRRCGPSTAPDPRLRASRGPLSPTTNHTNAWVTPAAPRPDAPFVWFVWFVVESLRLCRRPHGSQ